MQQLTVNPKFRDVARPLHEDEFKLLEENILRDGRVLQPIITWKGTIVDGHNRWQIIQKYWEQGREIPFETEEMEFPDDWAVVAWICNNQLGRRNLTNEERTYMIGKQYEAEKMTVKNPTGVNQHGKEVSGHFDRKATRSKTAHALGEKHGMAEKSIRRSGEFALGVDTADAISPGAKEDILSGKAKVPKSVVAEIPKMEPEQQREVIRAVRSGLPWEKKSTGRTSKETKALVAEIQNTLYKSDQDVEHDVDTLVEMVDATVQDFIANVRQTLVFYSTVLNEDGAREKVTAALEKAETAIRKEKELVS